MHSFPHDASLKRAWIRFVRTCRSNFVQTKYSLICSKHFAPDCYPDTYRMQEEMGFPPKKKILLPGAVPTIQKHDQSRTSNRHTSTCPSRKRKKRQKLKVSLPAATKTRARVCRASTMSMTTVTSSPASSAASPSQQRQRVSGLRLLCLGGPRGIYCRQLSPELQLVFILTGCLVVLCRQFSFAVNIVK